MWRDFYSGCAHGQADEAATKLISLVLGDITKKWTNPPITWELAATQFAIRFGQDSLP
jgi:putative transposase